MSNEITGTFADGKCARVLHAGNTFPVMSILASTEMTNYPGIAANNGNTVDRWRPFENQVLSPDEFDATEWSATRADILSDGQTFDEGVDASSSHFIEQAFTFTAGEWVFSVKVERQTMTGLRIQSEDGTSTFYAEFDLRSGTVANVGAGTSADIVDLGNGVFELRTYFTAAAGTNRVAVIGYDAVGDTTSYTGTNRTTKLLRAVAHESVATLRYDLFQAMAGSCVGIAAHNLFSCGGRIIIEHDSNEDDTWTEIDSVSPGSNGPIMFFFDAVTSARWRITVDRGVLPEIGVFRVGAPLKMQRSFYGGATIPRMSRDTKIIGNISGSGELLGRSKRRTTLRGQYAWDNLEYDWVRENLDGPGGLIQSIEAEPFFVSWRPSETNDVDYVMHGQVSQPPVAKGMRDMWQFAISGEVHAYE